MSVGAWGARTLGKWVWQKVAPNLIQSRDSFLPQEAVEDLVTRLSELKGSFTKIGQLISIYGEFFLPSELVPIFKQLQSQTVAVEFNVIHDVLKKQLGDRLKELDIDEEPIGCASLAQVHRCYHRKSGRMMALKIQYPGIKSAIKSDIQALKQWFRLWRLLPESRGVDALFDEIKTMLEAELDYIKEKQWTSMYAQKIQNDKRFRIPKIWEEFCSSSILALEYVPSYRLDSPYVAQASVDQKRQWSQALLDLYFRELFEWGWVQTDPHMGNFGIDQGDGRTIVLYDFGALRQYSESFLKVYYQLIVAALEGDDDKLLKASYELGFLDPDDSARIKELFLQFCYTVMEPFYEPGDPRLISSSVLDAEGFYDWASSDINRRLARLSWEMIKAFHLKPPPKEVLFLDRKTGGIFVLMRSLGVSTQPRPLLLGYLSRVI